MVDYESEIKEIKESLRINNEEHKEMLKRLNEKDINDALIQQKLASVDTTVNRIEIKIDEQNKVPINRWNTVVVAVITGIVSAGIGAVISMLIK